MLSRIMLPGPSTSLTRPENSSGAYHQINFGTDRFTRVDVRQLVAHLHRHCQYRRLERCLPSLRMEIGSCRGIWWPTVAIGIRNMSRFAWTKPSRTRRGERWATSAGLATEYVTSIRTVASLTMEPMILAEYKAQLDYIVNTSVRASVITYIPLCTFAIPRLLGHGFGLLVWPPNFWLAESTVSLSSSLSSSPSYLAGKPQHSSLDIRHQSPRHDRQQITFCGFALCKRIFEKTEATSRLAHLEMEAVALDDVEFRYKQRDASRVLRGVSMDIPAGSYAACVGPSGCGTLLPIGIRVI